MRVVIGTLIGLALLVAIVLGARNELRVRCEVCMDYEGRHSCDVARAADQDHAILQATTAACAKISSGVTAGIRCGNTPPRSVTCTE